MDDSSVHIELRTRANEVGLASSCHAAIWIINSEASIEHVCAGETSWYRLRCEECGFEFLRLCHNVRQTLTVNQLIFRINCTVGHEATSLTAVRR
jgi:hypothetical protein